MSQLRKLVGKHINTIVGILHVQEDRGKTEQMCKNKDYIKASMLLNVKATMFEMTHTLDGIDYKLDMAEERISELEDIA